MRRAIAAALLAIAPELAGAQAQLSTTPLDVPITCQLLSVNASLASWSASAPASDLFIACDDVFDRTSFDQFGYRTLERPRSFAFATPLAGEIHGVAGLLNESGGDGKADLAYVDTTTHGADLYFGDAPSTRWQPPGLDFGSGFFSGQLWTAHLLANKTRDVLVFTDDGKITAVDFGGTGATPVIASTATWTDSGGSAADSALLRLRLSPNARSGGVDLARNRILGSSSYAVDLFWLQDAAPPALGPGLYTLVTVPFTLEPRGAGALDVDFDGIPDLVVAVASVSGATRKLVWLKNVGAPPAPFAAPVDLSVAGIVAPMLLRPIDLDGTPAIAVWDGAPHNAIVVVTSEGGQLRTWEASTGGRLVSDMVAGDVVGSPLADLVVAYADPAAVQVFADSGDAFPSVSWSPGFPPARAPCGFDLPLQVQATDDGTVAKVEWFVAGSTTPAATLVAPPYAFAVPKASLPCSASSIQITARAVDDGGLWSEVSGNIPLYVDAPPSISWTPGPPPAQAPSGVDLPLQVEASDDVQVVAVKWFLNGSSTPAATQGAPPYAFTIDGQSLCGAAHVQVTARAVDNLGQSSQVTATVGIFAGTPVLRLSSAGQTPPAPLASGQTLPVPLVPGGSPVKLAAQVTGVCNGTTALGWLRDRIPLGAVESIQGDRYDLLIPEQAYPAVTTRAKGSLDATVTAQAVGPGGTATAAVGLAFDLSGLLEVDQISDRAALAPGDLALLTTTIRSRISVALPQVRLDDLLDGIEPAGTLQVEGAGADIQLAAGKTSVTLDQVPGGGAPVTIRLPVRRTLARGGLSLAQAVALPSESPMSLSVSANLRRAAPPGCGCSQGGASPVWSILLLLVGATAARLRSSRRWRSPVAPG